MITREEKKQRFKRILTRFKLVLTNRNELKRN